MRALRSEDSPFDFNRVIRPVVANATCPERGGWDVKWDVWPVKVTDIGELWVEYEFDTRFLPVAIVAALEEKWPHLRFEWRVVEEEGWVGRI